MFTAAGTSSMCAGSRLERCFRDVHMITQHIGVVLGKNLRLKFFLVDPYLVRLIERLVADPGWRARLGCNLRRKVESEYAATVVAGRWEHLFDDVVAEARQDV